MIHIFDLIMVMKWSINNLKIINSEIGKPNIPNKHFISSMLSDKFA